MTPAKTPDNPYKLYRRVEKVKRLVTALHNADITASQLRRLNNEKWLEIAEIVGVHYPSWESQAEVIRDLEALEAKR